MADLAREFSEAVARALDLAQAGERARVLISTLKTPAPPLYPARMELLYEMAYLRVFVEWESFQEACFIRYLCGYSSPNGTVASLRHGRYPSLAAAEAAVLGGRRYRLWHNPSDVIRRSQGFMTGGPLELVLASHQTRLEWFAAIRHRIAHNQADARIQFDQASTRLAGKRYAGGRPGRLLRDVDASTPPSRWLAIIAHELTGLANQIAP